MVFFEGFNQIRHDYGLSTVGETDLLCYTSPEDGADFQDASLAQRI
jgi:hypothetical protein